MQTWNGLRALDFILGVDGVDAQRIGLTGASGGGTQTLILSAIDERIAAAFPCVMTSTAMQGGCTCENASLLRVDTGNVEFAALFAPRPQGMTTADDWTRTLSTKSFPELQALYASYGRKANVFLQRGEHFPHNYNAVTRTAFYTFLNQHFKLGQTAPVIERDYEPLTREQLTVWDAQRPAPNAAGPEFERRLLQWFNDDADKQLRASAATPDGLRKGLGAAVEVLIGRTYATAGEVEWQLQDKHDRGAHLELTGMLTNKTHREEVNVKWLYPKQWNGRAIL